MKSSSSDTPHEASGEGGESTKTDENGDNTPTIKIDDDSNDTTKSVKQTDSDGSNQKVIKFDKGKTSKSYSDAVLRGESTTYILGALSGQNMTIDLSSLEDNAVFRIKTPSGKNLGEGTDEEGVTKYNGTLPESGKYKIIVTSTRGNATYKVNFGVSAKEKAEDKPETGGGKTTVVKFRKGGSSASYSNAVIRGDRDTYILGASSGQVMSVGISSLEDNAVFDIIAPNGRRLVNETASWSGQLPSDGKYKIIVGGTRGNATYKINFAVR